MDALLVGSGVGIGIVVWLRLLYRYDRFEREPLRAILAVGFWGGLLSAAGAVGINEILVAFFGIPLGQVTLASSGIDGSAGLAPRLLLIQSSALGEEVCKAVATVFMIKRYGDLDEPIDAMLYGMTVALGFAAFENVLYSVRFGPQILISRNLLSVPGHMGFSAIWAYGLASAKLRAPGLPLARALAPFVAVAAFCHAVFNSFVMTRQAAGALLGVLLLVGLVRISHVRLTRLAGLSPFRPAGYCGTCGARLTAGARFCRSCGRANPAVIQGP